MNNAKRFILNRLEDIQLLGQRGLQFCEHLGRAGIFLIRLLCTPFVFKKSYPLLIQALFSVGVLSIMIIVLSAGCIGMVIGLQSYNTLRRFGAEQQLGQLVALSIVRELGPVVTALLFAGRAGSALTAEIGLMKATEQLDSLEMMGVDPYRQVFVPRFWASFIALPILTLFFEVVAIMGGYGIGVLWLGVDKGLFWNVMQSSVNFQSDILNGLIKSAVFGFVIAWIATFQGKDAVPTAEGVGQATTRTVIYSALMTLGLDFILTAMMMSGW